ncbi:universal stress protein [Tissierella creatinini]|nr:universal stress protein [Tissierella creatinini]TJX66524.1 universal stress protein [Soehngenia saccharolytica]
MKKILVPIDGSDSAKRALDEAKKIAQCMNSEIMILNVITPIPTFGNARVQFMEEVQSLGKINSTELFKNALDDFTGKVDTKTRIGNPADEIILEAEEGGYDAIIMGSRGQGTFARTLLGSVSNKVLHHSNVSVFIVK